MSNPCVNKLQELVKIARDGNAFYEAVAEKVANPILRATFRRQAQAKRELVAALADRLGASGAETPTAGTYLGSLHRFYTEIKESFSKMDQDVYVAELESAEDRLLQHFSDAIKECADADLVVHLQSLLPTVRARHDEMRALKQRTESSSRNPPMESL